MRDSTTLQRSRYRNLVELTQVDASPTSFRFATEDGWPLVIEAHAPGVFRITIVPTGTSTTDRASELADLLSRPESIGEAECEPIAGGWRLTQGEDALEILANPLRLLLRRRGQAVLSAGTAELAAVAHAEDTTGDEASWRVAFVL